MIFDTGSSGLRILEGAIPGADLTDLHGGIQSSYGGGDHGLIMRGEQVEAYLNFKNLQSKQKIPFMLINEVAYINKGDTSSWVQLAPNESVLPPGSTYSGFSANMGVGMRMDDSKVGSPITQMPGNGKYLIHFPQPGNTDGGYVVINPDAYDIAKFKNWQQLNKGTYNLPNGQASFMDDELHGILTIGGVPYPDSTLLDTGNPVIWTEGKTYPAGVDSITTGTTVTMSLATMPAVTSNTFSVQQKGQVQINHNSKKDANSFGAQFFQDYDVLFDSVNGRIWVAQK